MGMFVESNTNRRQTFIFIFKFHAPQKIYQNRFIEGDRPSARTLRICAKNLNTLYYPQHTTARRGRSFICIFINP